AVAGVCSDGLIITRLPAARMPPIGLSASVTGKFHGEILPTTPSGMYCTLERAPSRPYGKLLLRFSVRSHSGRCLRAYFKAFNGGRMSNMREFSIERRPKSL